MFNSILLAAVYGTLVCGDFVKAPFIAKVDGYNRPVESLDEPQANALGYKMLVDERPPCSSNEYAVAVGYEERGSGFQAACTRIYRTYDKRTIVPLPRRWTPLSIKRSAAKIGYWDALKAFLVAANAYDDFCMAQYEAEDDADFVMLMAAARQKFGDAVVDAILNNAEVEP